MGGILLGHTTVCAVEIEPYPRKVLLQRQRDGILPKFPIWDDVTTFDGNPWRGKVDIICGGFPCQDISVAGKGAGIEGSRSSMWKHMARIIGEVRPQFAFVENSPMLMGRGLSTVLADLAEMGYDAEWGIVGAHHVSAPHKRDRIWILATDSNVCRCDDGSDTERQHEVNHSQVGTHEEDQQSRSVWQHWTSEDCGNVADSNVSQRERMRCTSGSEQEYADSMPFSAWWGQDPAESPKSNVGRMAHGVAARVDRLKSIGNGQVPAVAELAWKTLTNKI